MTTALEINLVDEDVYQRGGPPHEQFTWLRQNAPVYWHAYGGAQGWPGFWAVTRHDDIEHVSRHPEVFSSARRTSNFYEFPESEVARHRLGILSADPPLHTRLRGLVNRGFTPRMTELLEHGITQICARLLDDVTRRGEADFATEIAAPLPVEVICELVGAPTEDRARLYELTNIMAGASDPEVGSGIAGYSQAVAEMSAYAAGLAEQRRRQPRDDIVTRLLVPNDEKDELTAAEFAVFFNTLIIAGNETTRNAASGGMLAFFEHPDQWRRLVADPGRDSHSGRGDRPLGQPAQPSAPNRHLHHRTRRADDRRGRQGRDVLHLGQPGRGRVRRPPALRHRPRPQSPHRLRTRPALLPRPAPSRARATDTPASHL